MELCFIQWTNLRTEAQDTESQIILRDCSCCWKMWWIWLLTSQKPINNPPYLMVVVQSLSGGRPNPMDCSTPGFPALRYTLELAQTHVHWVCWRCHPTISSSVVPFAFCFQSFPASGSFPMSRLSASVGQSIGASASASVLPVNIQGWFLSGLTGLISLQSVMRQVSFVFFFYHIWYTPEIWAAHQCCQISPQWWTLCVPELTCDFAHWLPQKQLLEIVKSWNQTHRLRTVYLFLEAPSWQWQYYLFLTQLDLSLLLTFAKINSYHLGMHV